MSDIVERLFSHANAEDVDAWMTCKEAADEIERLRAEVERLKRSRDRYRMAWEEERRRFTEARAALEEK